MNKMSASAHLCKHQIWRNLPTGIQNIADDSIFELIYDMAPHMDDVFIECHFLHNHRCFFYPIYTEEGLCYTFNALSLDRIYTDE